MKTQTHPKHKLFYLLLLVSIIGFYTMLNTQHTIPSQEITKLDNLDYLQAKFTDGYFSGKSLEKLYRVGEVEAHDMVVSNFTWQDVSMTYNNFKYMTFKDGKISNTNLSNSTFEHVTFENMTLDNVNFSKSDFHHIKFHSTRQFN